MAESGPYHCLQAQRGTRRFRRLAWMIGLATTCVVADALVTDANAQQQLRLSRSSVDVDWSVIDELDNAGPARLVPGTRTRSRATPTAATTAPAPAPRTTASTTRPATASTEKAEKRGKT